MFSESGIPNGFLLEPMTPDDLGEVLAIEEASFTAPWTRNIFTQEFSTPMARSLTVRINTMTHQILAGYAIAWIVADEVDIQKIAVKPDFRRRGTATCLLKALLQSARKEGCLTATLEVRRSNTAAIRLYEKLGFVVKGIRQCYYVEQGEDALIMGTAIPSLIGSSEL